MAHPIDILLITGFLGSGKTTFLNSLMEQLPHDRRIAVLMNEFGEIGVDGALVQGEGYDLVEISRGSIFCICVKTDYIKAMHRIAHELRPDLLIIETTGVANPADMGRDLQLGVFKGKFALRDQVCIVDPTSFPDLFEIYTSIEKQVTSSQVFILNKTDLASREDLTRSTELIRRHNPGGRIFETRYCRVPIDLILPAVAKPITVAAAFHLPAHALGGKELDDVLDEIFADRGREFTPPDSLLSEVFVWKGVGYADFAGAVRDLPGGILRCKGFLKFGDEVKLFNRTLQHTSIDEVKQKSIPEALVNKLIVIYPHSAATAVDDYLRSRHSFQRVPGSLKDNRLIPLGMTHSGSHREQRS